MNDDVKLVMDELEDACNKALDHVKRNIAKLRAGKATPSMLDAVQVEYYGNTVPINQVANVSTPDARTLMVKPWEKSMLEELEKAITYANLGLNPQNDGEQIMINIPPLTEERRMQLVKQVKGESESGKIGLRGARKDAMDMIKMLQKDGLSEDMGKDAEGDIQKAVDGYGQKIDEAIELKEKEIMTI